MPSKYDMVKVSWIDAESMDDWTPVEEVEHVVATIESVGWFISENKSCLTMALNHDTKNSQLSCIMKIPLGMIVSIKTLKLE